MKNKLGYVGLLSLLGFLAFIKHQNYYLLFFVYAVWFRYFWVLPDELFRENVRRAATPAFFVGMVIPVINAGLTAFGFTKAFYTMGMTLGFVVSCIVFLSIMTALEIREKVSRSE